MSVTSQQTLSPISLTASSLGSHLLPTEEVLSLCNFIGLYSDSTKSPHQQNGTAYLTSHRIIYVDEADPRSKSGYLHLKDVRYTEHFRGFLKSSPKVILGVGDGSSPDGVQSHSQNRAQVAQLQDEMASVRVSEEESNTAQDATTRSGSDSRWLCPVCGFSNTANDACQLCGVKKDPSASTSAARIAASAVPSRKSASTVPPPPPPPTTGPEIPCPTCTFLNHPSMSRCEVCDSPLGTEVIPAAQQEPSNRKRLSVPTQNSLTPSPADSPATRPTTPAALPSQPSTVKLSFRKGGDKAFYDALTTALRRGAWKAKSSSRPGSSPAQATTPIPAAHDIDGRSTPSSSSGPRVVGIEGLLSSYNSKSASDTSQMSDALKDLKALMSKAKDMVELAEGLEARLRKREAEVKSGRGGETVGDEGEEDPTESEAATLIRSSLVKLGLPAPAITKEMAKNEEEYHRDLAKELGYVLLGREGRGGGLMGRGSVGGGGTASKDASDTGKGIVGLDEVWCVWNRLRGVALIPPSHLLSSTRYLPNLTTPSIHLRIFPNGLRVLSTAHFDDDVFSKRLLLLMRADEAEAESQVENVTATTIAFGNGITPLQLAQREGVSLMLVQQLLSSVELAQGEGGAGASAPIVRDEVDGQVRWYRNRFEELAV